MTISDRPVIAASPDPVAGRRLTLRRPDDWHVHLRDGDMLASVVNYTARQFARAGSAAEASTANSSIECLSPAVATAVSGCNGRDP